MITEWSFHALDVETANSSWASICQIGIVHVTNGVVTDQWSSYVNPEEHFDTRNIGLHGIDEGAVCGAPCFPDLHPELCQRLSGGIVVSHSGFDRGAFRRAGEKYGTADLNVQWLDSVWIARQAWPELPRHKLDFLAHTLGLEFRHHDALEDARIAAEVVLAACRETGRTVADWIALRDSKSRSSPQQTGATSAPSSPTIRRIAPNALTGERVVFTGNAGVRRIDLIAMAVSAGGQFERDVTERTTMLVVGDNQGRISRKQRKAEELRNIGQPLRVLTPDEFIGLLTGR